MFRDWFERFKKFVASLTLLDEICLAVLLGLLGIAIFRGDWFNVFLNVVFLIMIVVTILWRNLGRDMNQLVKELFQENRDQALRNIDLLTENRDLKAEIEKLKNRV